MFGQDCYSRVPYVCHVMKDCYERSGTSKVIYLKTHSFILKSMDHQTVYENYLLSTDPTYKELKQTVYYSSAADLQQSQVRIRNYLTTAKTRWLENLIGQAKKEGL